MTAIGAVSSPIAGVGVAGRQAAVAERGCAPGGVAGVGGGAFMRARVVTGRDGARKDNQRPGVAPRAMLDQGSSVLPAAAPRPARAAGRSARADRRIQRLLAVWAPVLVLILLCVVIAAINPRFLTVGNFVRIAQSAMIPLCLGLGATFVIIMGSIDLSVEGVWR